MKDTKEQFVTRWRKHKIAKAKADEQEYMAYVFEKNNRTIKQRKGHAK